MAVLIIVMGVSGTGKSTLGNALAEACGIPYIEGDDLHPKSNVAKMSAGQPLTDADREPWLKLIRATAEHTAEEQRYAPSSSVRGEGVVISCSALKRYYRDILRGERTLDAGDAPIRSEGVHPNLENPLPTFFVFINGPRDVLIDRMKKRSGHFMKVSMLDSQLETLQNPMGEDGVVVVPLEDSTEVQVREAKSALESMPGFSVTITADTNQCWGQQRCRL